MVKQLQLRQNSQRGYVGSERLWQSYGGAAVSLAPRLERQSEQEGVRAGGSESRRVNGVAGARCFSACSSLTEWANASVLPPHGGHSLWPIGHDAMRGR